MYRPADLGLPGGLIFLSLECPDRFPDPVRSENSWLVRAPVGFRREGAGVTGSLHNYNYYYSVFHLRTHDAHASVIKSRANQAFEI